MQVGECSAAGIGKSASKQQRRAHRVVAGRRDLRRRHVLVWEELAGSCGGRSADDLASFISIRTATMNKTKVSSIEMVSATKALSELNRFDVVMVAWSTTRRRSRSHERRCWRRLHFSHLLNCRVQKGPYIPGCDAQLDCHGLVVSTVYLDTRLSAMYQQRIVFLCPSSYWRK